MSLEFQLSDFHFGSRGILKNISFSLDNGQCLSVLGCNGAGKTTLVRILAGLWKSGARINLNGSDIHELDFSRRNDSIAYVAQEPNLFSDSLTVLDLMLLVQNANRISWQVSKDSLVRSEEILELLDIKHFAEAYPAELSGGQRQLVYLALALVRKPKLLLLDEPTSALDIANQLHLLGLVRQYTKKNDILTMMILHDLNLASRFSDKIMLLKSGSIFAYGTPSETLTVGNIAGVYDVDCEITTTSSSEEPLMIIYPLERIGNLEKGGVCSARAGSAHHE